MAIANVYEVVYLTYYMSLGKMFASTIRPVVAFY